MFYIINLLKFILSLIYINEYYKGNSDERHKTNKIS
jgi:hypothetical protein